MQEKLFDFLKQDITELKQDIGALNEKVDQLLEFKWKVIGGTILASLILTGMFQVVYIILEKRI